MVGGRQCDRVLVSEVLEEPDLADVHAQHRGEHLLGERRQLHDDGIEIATFEGRPVHGRRDTDTLADLLMTTAITGCPRAAAIQLASMSAIDDGIIGSSMFRSLHGCAHNRREV